MMVAQGVEVIPPRFRKRIKNVVFVVEDEPTREQRRKMRLRHDETLFGLYEGIPHTVRGAEYGGLAFPDKITIFKKPIEEAAKTAEDIHRIVKDTMWHEVAHHFGLGERDVRTRERRRKK